MRNNGVYRNSGRSGFERSEFERSEFKSDEDDFVRTDSMDDESHGGDGHRGMFQSGKRFTISLIGHLRSRLELLGLELSQEKGRLVSVVMMGLLGYMMVGVSLLLAILLAVGASWDTAWRLQVLGVMLIGSIVILIVISVLLHRRLQLRSTLFKSSLRELARDEQALERMP